jgi:hypothetical protein
MTTSNTAVAPPMTTAARRYSEQVHILVDTQTREYILGLALIAQDRTTLKRPKEGEAARYLLDDAIAAAYRGDRKGYEQAVLRGREELARRKSEAAEPAPATA